MTIPQIDWSRVLADLTSVAVAYLLALPIAWDRALPAGQHCNSTGCPP